MEFNYDTIADAAVLRLSDQGIYSQIELENGVSICLGKNGEIICVEILDFSKHQDLKEFQNNDDRGIPIRISGTRLMDESYMERFYPNYCAAQRKLGKRPWDVIWRRAETIHLRGKS